MMHEATEAPRIEAISLGPRCDSSVEASPLAAAAGLLPAVDAGVISPPGAEALRALPGWLGARALLLHGRVFRDEVALHLMRGATLPTRPEDIRVWLAEPDQNFFDRLLVRAALEGLAHYATRPPNPLVEAVRVRWPNPLPAADRLMEQPDLAREIIMTQTIAWAAATPAALPLVHDGARLGSVLADALALVLQLTGVAAAPSSPASASGAAAVLEQFTGRPVPAGFAADLGRVGRLILVPAVGLGDKVLPWRLGNGMVLWAEAHPPRARPADPVPGRAPVWSPEERGALMRLLADPAAAGLLERLAAQGPAPAHRLAAALDIHPSTVSRQLKRLVQAGLVAPVADGTRVVYHAEGAALLPLQDWLGQMADRLHASRAAGTEPPSLDPLIRRR